MTPDSPISSLEKPWLRLPPKMGKGGATESPKSFDRFERFRDLSASERTLSRLAQLLGTTEKSLQKVSSKHDWADRAAAWELKTFSALSDHLVVIGAFIHFVTRRSRRDGHGRRLCPRH